MKVTVRSQAADPEGFGRFRPCCNSTNGVPWTLQSDAGALSLRSGTTNFAPVPLARLPISAADLRMGELQAVQRVMIL